MASKIDHHLYGTQWATVPCLKCGEYPSVFRFGWPIPHKVLFSCLTDGCENRAVVKNGFFRRLFGYDYMPELIKLWEEKNK